MNQSLNARTGLLVSITALHIGALWMLIRMAAPSAVVPPTPLPMVMAEVMPMLQPKTEVPRQQRQPEPRPEPKPVQKQKPQPQAKPVPKTTDSEKALSEPKPVDQPRTDTPAKAEPTPAAAPPSPPAPPAPPAPLVPPRFNAAYLNNPPPVYPPLLRRAGEEGRVVLRIFVTAEGTAGEVRVLTPSSSKLFDEAAMAAVRKWRFVPARRGDAAVAEWVQVPIDFKLN